MFRVITIDGPAASGKTSVSRELATKMGWKWVSTGAFYRAVAYAALQSHIDLSDVNALRDLALGKDWQVVITAAQTEVYFKNQKVTSQIFAEEVGSAASKISSHPEVREALLQAQRNCAGPEGLVAEGRDCGTVVFPDAAVKIYLTAASEKRAIRRATEKGSEVSEVLKAQKLRDNQDSQRKAAPMQIPENAHVIDTSETTLQTVVAEIEKIVRRHPWDF